MAIDIKENSSSAHPNSKRKKQKIQLVKELAPVYYGDHAREKGMNINATVCKSNACHKRNRLKL